jgi:hypothetical protein
MQFQHYTYIPTNVTEQKLTISSSEITLSKIIWPQTNLSLTQTIIHKYIWKKNKKKKLPAQHSPCLCKPTKNEHAPKKVAQYRFVEWINLTTGFQLTFDDKLGHF